MLGKRSAVEPHPTHSAVLSGLRLEAILVSFLMVMFMFIEEVLARPGGAHL